MLDKLEDAINSAKGKVKAPIIPPHWRASKDRWTITGWKENEIQFNRHKIIDEIEKIELQLYEDLMNHKNTIPRPIYLTNVDNIITNLGLNNSAGLDTGDHTNSNTHNSLGDDATTPAVGDTDLTSEISGGTPTYAKLAFDTDGQRKTVNQTAKYGMLWDDGDIDVTPAISIKESGVHWHVSDASKIHSHVTFPTFTFDAGDLFVIQINELQANA